MRKQLSKLCKLDHTRAIRVNAVDELININSEPEVLTGREASGAMQEQ